MEEKPTLRLSVHAFIERALPGGDLSAANMGAMAQGTHVHRLLQQAAGPDWLTEVPVRFVRENDRARLELGGRMDAFVAGNVPRVLEIKSTHQDRAGVGQGLLEHWHQARVYAAVCCLQGGYGEVDVTLGYVLLPGWERVELTRREPAETLTGWFLALCDGVLDELAGEADRLAERDRSLAELPFPYTAFRPGQRDMAALVYRTVRDEGRLMLQAPTGIGKTMAVLYPALKALGKGWGQRVFYLTARNTGRTAATDALEQLAQTGLRARWVTITAKERCCPHPGMPCDPLLCDRAAGFFDRLPAALDEAPPFGGLGPAEIDALAGRHRLCPYELSLILAQGSEVVLGDYNYAFDPRVRLRRFFDEGGDYTLLIDEAHNLVDRGRAMYSAALTRQDVAALSRALPGGKLSGPPATLKKAVRALSKTLTALAAPLKEERTPCQVYSEPPEELTDAVRRFLNAAETALAGPEQSYTPQLLDLFFLGRQFWTAAEDYDGCCTCYLETAPLAVRIFCMDPSTRLQKVYDKVRAAVFFSATLTPSHYFLRLLTAADTDYQTFDSPFLAENLRVALAPVQTAFRYRETTLSQVASLLYTMVTARPGHYIAFLPSYQYLRMVHERFVSEHEDVPALAQRPAMDEDSRRAFLSRMDAADGAPLIAFAVMGGIFGEGVDLVGDRLIGAAVVGVGLPQICLERDLLRRYHDGLEESGFDFAYRLPGLVRVMQAAGRVIRSEDDRGAVLLIDPRFAREDVLELLPPWWHPLSIVANERALAGALRAFWGND